MRHSVFMIGYLFCITVMRSNGKTRPRTEKFKELRWSTLNHSLPPSHLPTANCPPIPVPLLYASPTSKYFPSPHFGPGSKFEETVPRNSKDCSNASPQASRHLAKSHRWQSHHLAKSSYGKVVIWRSRHLAKSPSGKVTGG